MISEQTPPDPPKTETCKACEGKGGGVCEEADGREYWDDCGTCDGFGWVVIEQPNVEPEDFE